MTNRLAPENFPYLKVSEADRQLLERSFVADDPEAIEGLLSALPSDAKPTIRARYDLSGVAGRAKLRCAHCHGRRHFKGFIVDLRAGGVALIGIDCGQKAFGFDWEGVVATFKAALDRQLDLRRLTAVAPILPSFVAELEALDASRIAHAFPVFFNALRQTGQPGRRLARAAREDGKMTVVERVRNRAKEEARVRREEPWLLEKIEDADTPAGMKEARRTLDRWISARFQEFDEVEVVIGRLPDPYLFSAHTNIGGLKKGLALAQKSKAALDLDTGAHANLRVAMGDVQDAVEFAKDAMDVLAALDRFTTRESLEQVGSWLNSETGHHFATRGRELVDTRGNLRFGVPNDWSLPAMPELARMQNALSGTGVL